MFSELQIEKIEKKYLNMLAKLGDRKDDFTKILVNLTGDEALCYKFLVGAMPLSDAATYDGELLLRFVKHSLSIRETIAWGDQIPVEHFLNDVLFYRVNNENIEDYRYLLSGELLPRIAGMSMHDAALEVNYWCYEKATYQSSDERTISPLTMMKNGNGRCGEESVFTVSALRSVGIPARQCYSPRWSHCDDNHAWVEVWIDGEWYYMGACEPEPVLNKGWFTYASSKAMMVHSHVFSDFTEGEPVVAKNNCTTELNHLSRYADTVELFVLVLDEAKKPLSGARVQFQVVNYSELADIAALNTEEDGVVKLTTGLGSLVVHVSIDEKYMARPISITKNEHIVFDFSKRQDPEFYDFDFQAPIGKIKCETEVLPERTIAYQKKLTYGEAVRRNRKESFFTEAAAKEYAQRFSGFQAEIAEFLVAAKANYEEIQHFLNTDYDLLDKVNLLRQLRRKDFIDCKAVQLEDALCSALPFKSQWEESVYQQYVLCSRIQNEYLVPYRAKIAEIFSFGQRFAFQNNPCVIAQYIEKTIETRDDLDYAQLAADPVGLLQLKAGSRLSKKILFIAICRTLGIPARFHSVTGAVEFFQNGFWKNLDGSITETVKLTIQNSGYPLRYFQNFSIAKLIHGEYKTLVYPELKIDHQAELKLDPGHYRILLANRQIDGAILTRAFYVNLSGSDPITVEISGREGDIRSRLVHYQIQNTELLDRFGRKTDLASVIRTHPKNIIALLDVQTEPTEHLLNEFLELNERYQAAKLSLVLLVSDEKSFEYSLLQKLLQNNQEAGVYKYEDCGLCKRLFEEVRAGDHRLPLVMVADEGLNEKFHFSNYNVGTAALLLQIADNL